MVMNSIRVLGGARAVCAIALAVCMVAAGLTVAGEASAQTRRGALPASFSEIADRLKPAVVQIQTNASAIGSGFLIDSEGHIVTNEHVIRGANRIAVRLDDERVYEVEVKGRDRLTDLALLKINGASDLPSVSFGDSDASDVGDWVLAIGNPAGYGGTVTAGIVSARDRVRRAGGPYDELIQTDTAINAGNSGGPLFNLDGEVIGVNTYGLEQRGGRIFSGIGFATPSSIAAVVINQLKQYGSTRRGWLGVEPQAMTQQLAQSVGLSRARGVMVRSVTPGGPAARAGVRRLDVILRFNGEPVADVREFQKLVSFVETGQQVALDIHRRGEGEIRIVVTIGRLGALEPETGARVMPASFEGGRNVKSIEAKLDVLTPQSRLEQKIADNQPGVIVQTVAQGGPAWGVLVPGDVILEINGEPVATPDEVETLLSGAGLSGEGETGSVPVLVKRFGEETIVAVPFD